MALELQAGDIFIGFVFPDEIYDQKLLLNYERLLDQQEKLRWQRFYFAKDRHLYLVSRALVRYMLSCFIDKTPEDIRFVVNAYGKPEVLNTNTERPIRFNLSHTDGLVMCAIVLADDIGVDVENVQKSHDSLTIAKHYFSCSEFEALQNTPENLQHQRFLEYWTLKEAYVKAKGLGLSLPLDQFSITFTHKQPISVRFDPQLQDNAEHWQFWQWYPDKNHIAAIALRSEQTVKYQLIFNRIVPLQSCVTC
jgi:4'-phosphopantetheinyl transferase